MRASVVVFLCPSSGNGYRRNRPKKHGSSKRSGEKFDTEELLQEAIFQKTNDRTDEISRRWRIVYERDLRWFQLASRSRQ